METRFKIVVKSSQYQDTISKNIKANIDELFKWKCKEGESPKNILRINQREMQQDYAVISNCREVDISLQKYFTASLEKCQCLQYREGRVMDRCIFLHLER